WNSAVGYRVREQILVSPIEVRLIDGFPLGVIGRMRPYARRYRSALSGLRGSVEHCSSHHRPGAAPVRKLVISGHRRLLALAEAEPRQEQQGDGHSNQSLPCLRTHWIS